MDRQAVSPAPILVVTANPVVREELRLPLTREGFAVDWTGEVSDALAGVARHEYALIVIDVTIGSEQAKTLCARVRDSSTIPLVVFAGHGTADHDLLEYLERGADAYVPRADRPRELVARIRALLRRADPPGSEGYSSAVEIGDVRLDRLRHEVRLQGVAVALTEKQYQLLELFLTHPNQVLPRSLILERVWGYDSPALANNLEVQITRLRRRIQPDPAGATPIRTVRGVGYLYSSDERDQS